MQIIIFSFVVGIRKIYYFPEFFFFRIRFFSGKNSKKVKVIFFTFIPRTDSGLAWLTFDSSLAVAAGLGTL